jgi:hypothetical protein
MTRPYSRRTFLRQTPNHSLKEYFLQRQIDLNIPWDDMAETAIQPVEAAMDALPVHVIQQVEGEFSQVMDMATARGVGAIIEEASLWSLDWSESFAAMVNEYERAMWTFLNEPRRFFAAGAFHEMDRVRFGWHRFVGHRLESAIDDGTLDVFGSKLASHYRRQGRGRHCHVDVYRREDPVRFCYFAYPEDAASTEIGYDEQGHIERRARQSAFEVIFVYRPEEGMLDLYARGTKQEKESLAEIFCINILGLAGLPDEDGREPFDLTVLKDPSFDFATDTHDRVQRVDVQLIRMDLPFDRSKGAGRRLQLEAKSTGDAPQALHNMMAETLNPMNIELTDVIVGRAKLCFTFRPIDNQRPKTLTFEVGYPDRCTLKDNPHDQIARKYLREWGIARDEPAPVYSEAS